MSQETGNREPLFKKVHPAVILFFFLSVIQAAAASISTVPLFSFTILFLILSFYTKFSLSMLYSKFRPFFIVLIFTFLINAVFSQDTLMSLMLTVRFALIIGFSLLLSHVTKPEELVSVISVPFKGKHAENMKTILMIALKTIPSFIEKTKSVATSISEMPEYANAKIKAVLKPDLYISPIVTGMLDMAGQTAEDIENGVYSVAKPAKMTSADILISLIFITASVVYAL